MGSRLRRFGLPLAAAAGCLAVVAPASAGTGTPFSGSVANGGCVTAQTVTVSAPSRIEATTSSTAQNNTNVYAEIVGNGKTLAGGSFVSYDTPGAGSYDIRICAVYQQQNPPTMQYSGVYGTGPAGQPVLNAPPQPQPPTNTNPGGSTIAYSVSGKVAIRTSAGLAWFTITTTRTGAQNLRIVNPQFGKARVITGLHSTVSGTTVHVLGNNGLNLTLGHNRLSFTSGSLKASGKIVRGTYKVVV